MTVLSLPVNVEHLSVYLVLRFHPSEFCSFPHRERVHILLDLRFSISFLGASVDVTVVYISDPICLLRVYGKVTDFCVVTMCPATLL